MPARSTAGAEGGERHRLARHPADTAAHQEVLVEHRHGRNEASGSPSISVSAAPISVARGVHFRFGWLCGAGRLNWASRSGIGAGSAAGQARRTMRSASGSRAKISSWHPRACRAGRQLRAGRAPGLDIANDDRRAARHGGAQRDEMSAVQVPNTRPAAAPCRAGRQRAMSISRKVRPIRKLLASAATFLASFASRHGDHPGKPRLRPRHQIGHGPERQFSRFVRNLASNRRSEQLRPVHHHQHRVPVVAIGIEHAIGKAAAAHLLLDVEAFEVHYAANAVLLMRPAMRVSSASGRSPSTTTCPYLSASVTKSPSGSTTHCCTGALCSSNRRSRCDLRTPNCPAPEGASRAIPRGQQGVATALRGTHVDRNLHPAR